MTGVATQPDTTRMTKLHFIPLPPLTRPIPTMAPMTACVLDTGTAGSGGKFNDNKKFSNVSDENKIKTSDSDKITIQATIGENDRTFLPTVLMARWE